MTRLFLFVVTFIAVGTLDAFAQRPPMVLPALEVPTISEWGMIATVVALGLIGVFALRKRLASGSR